MTSNSVPALYAPNNTMPAATHSTAGTATRATVRSPAIARSRVDSIGIMKRARLNPATASSRCAPPGQNQTRMWVATIRQMPIARNNTVVSSRPTRRPGASEWASAAIDMRCQSAGTRPSSVSSRSEHST